MNSRREADDLIGDDRLRFVDILLEEVCSDSGAAPALAPRPRRRDQWLYAALVLMGVSVAVGVGVLSRSTAAPAQDPQPAPAPAPVPKPDPAPAPHPDPAPPKLAFDLLKSIVEIGPTPSNSHPLDQLATWGPEQAKPRQKLPRLPPLSELGPGGSTQVLVPARPPRPIELPPAVALMRDLLPSRTSALRAELTDAAQLAEQPAHLLSLRCEGGDGFVLAQELTRFSSLRRLQLGELFDDHVANALANAAQLQELEVGCRGLTDAGLRRLARLPALHTLVLWGDVSTLSGASLPALAHLRSLRIAAPIVTSRQGPLGLDLLQHVLQLRQLHELQLVLSAPPPDTANGQSALLAPLAAMTNLRRLSVVAQSGSLSSLVRGLPSLPLERLRLWGGELSQDDVEALGLLDKLIELDLGDAKFAAPDAAVASLARIAPLGRLVLGMTNLTAAHCHALMTALPDCVVYTDHEHHRPDGAIELRRSGRSAGAADRSPR